MPSGDDLHGGPFVGFDEGAAGQVAPAVEVLNQRQIDQNLCGFSFRLSPCLLRHVVNLPAVVHGKTPSRGGFVTYSILGEV